MVLYIVHDDINDTFQTYELSYPPETGLQLHDSRQLPQKLYLYYIINIRLIYLRNYTYTALLIFC